jgi:hypothetical protein
MGRGWMAGAVMVMCSAAGDGMAGGWSRGRWMGRGWMAGAVMVMCSAVGDGMAGGWSRGRSRLRAWMTGGGMTGGGMTGGGMTGGGMTAGGIGDGWTRRRRMVGGSIPSDQMLSGSTRAASIHRR